MPPTPSGKRLLQLGSEPGPSEAWFGETLVSSSGEASDPNALATGFEAGRYDWICSFLLVDQAQGGRAALREMLRVAGSTGVVALSPLGDASDHSQHGDPFVSDVQRQLPGVAVLQLVTADPCTASVDAVHFYSHDAAALQDMAKLAEQKEIGVRFFPASG